MAAMGASISDLGNSLIKNIGSFERIGTSFGGMFGSNQAMSNFNPMTSAGAIY